MTAHGWVLERVAADSGALVAGRRFTQGRGALCFGDPRGLAVDSRERVYVADTGNNRIVRISNMKGGGWVALSRQPGVHSTTPADPFTQPTPSHPSALTVDRRGRIYIVDTGNGRVVRVDDMTGRGWTVLRPPTKPANKDHLYHWIGIAVR